MSKTADETKKWGWYGVVLAQRNNAEANNFAYSVRPYLIKPMIGNRHRWAKIARRLNEQGIPAPFGGKWNSTTVKRTVERLGPELIEEIKKEEQVRAQIFLQGMINSEKSE